MKTLKLFLSAVLAGVSIGLGGVVFLGLMLRAVFAWWFSARARAT